MEKNSSENTLNGLFAGACELKVTGALTGLARACENNPYTKEATNTIIEKLHIIKCAGFADEAYIQKQIDRIHQVKFTIVPDCAVCKSPCGNTSDYDMTQLCTVEKEIRILKKLILSGLQDLADTLYHAGKLGFYDEISDDGTELFFYKVLCMVSYDFPKDQLAQLFVETAEINLKCATKFQKAIENVL